MLHTVSLKENHVFRRLYHRGATAGNRLLVVYCLRNGTGHSRLGLTVSAKLGHAVERNRMRRRLREVYRLHEAELLPGYDIVIVACHKQLYYLCREFKRMMNERGDEQASTLFIIRLNSLHR